MRFVRMFTNSLLAGTLGAAYLTVLVLQLNPHVPLMSGTTGRWFVTLAVFYGLHLAIAFYVLIVVREFFTMEPLSPGWASVRVLAWLSATGAAVAAAMMWLNANSFANAIGETAAQRMMAGAIATTASAVVLFGVAIAHYSAGRRASCVGATLFALASFASLALPLAARGPAVPYRGPLSPRDPAAAAMEPGPRVVMLLLDGAALGYIRTQAADGRLPNFSRLLASGASMYLATVRPTQPGPVWAAVATGMYPAKNGVRSAALYFARGDTRPLSVLPDHCFSHALVRFGAIQAVEATSEAWRVRPLWSIVSNAGLAAGIVAWPLTFPAQPVQGFVLSDRFHQQLGPLARFAERAAFPAEALTEAHTSVSGADEGDMSVDPDEPPEVSAARRDRIYHRAANGLQSRWPARLLALRLQALDVAGHRHFDDGRPLLFGHRAGAEERPPAQQLEHAYDEVDAAIGAVMATLAPDDLLLVISGFGMERLNLAKDVLSRVLGEPVMRGTHERAPDGFLIAWGSAINPGRRLRGSVVDVAPTVLYFLGLPIGRDMDGFVRTDIFKSAFIADRPIAFIASHN